MDQSTAEPQIASMDISEEIFEGENVNVTMTLTPIDEVESVRIILWDENRTEAIPPIDLWGDDTGIWVISIPNLEAGTIPWDLMVNNVLVDSGEVEIIVPEDDSPKWPLVLVALLFIAVFIAVEVAFKPGRRRKEQVDIEYEEIPEPEEFKNHKLIERKDRK